MLSTTLLLSAFVVGCGGGSGGSAPPVVPTIISTSPADAAKGVAINVKVTAVFSVAMDPATLATSFTLTSPGMTVIAGTVTFDATSKTAMFAPASALAGSTMFTATISTGAKDTAGHALASNKVWTFTTGAILDTTAPTVSYTTPASGATAVAINGIITATFSESMDPATISAATFTLTDIAAQPVAGTVSLAGVGTTAVFTPNSNLVASSMYTATITTGVADLAVPANTMAANFVWTFTTGTGVAAGPTPVILGTAANYVILAKSGVSTVPTSAVTGNLGVSPIDSTAITGFSLVADPSNQFSTSSQVTGKLYAADYTSPTPANLTTAVSDMETAYTDAAGRAADVSELGAGIIGGLTLAPGVYKWSTSVTIPTDVTLSGGPNDVWIFQVAGDLTMAGATTVVLSGGARPKNINWQVAGGAGVTLGAGAHLEGIVLAKTGINLGSTASVNGRLLAQTAVTLISNTVTQPAP